MRRRLATAAALALTTCVAVLAIAADSADGSGSAALMQPTERLHPQQREVFGAGQGQGGGRPSLLGRAIAEGAGLGTAGSTLSRKLGPALDGLDTVGRAVEAAVSSGIGAVQHAATARHAETEQHAASSAAGASSGKGAASGSSSAGGEIWAAAEQRPQERQMQERRRQRQQQKQRRAADPSDPPAGSDVGHGSGGGGKRSAQVCAGCSSFLLSLRCLHAIWIAQPNGTRCVESACSKSPPTSSLVASSRQQFAGL